MSCTGYRLPTVEEWQFACAGTDWDQQFVNTCSLTAKTNSVETAQRVQRYVWLRHNASFEEQPTATRHPNPNGLFDMYGNVDELVMNIHDVEVDSNNLDYRLIGFNVFDTQSTLHNRITNKTELRTFKRNEVHPANGFRLVRTVKTP
jgi:formylglycine-generating enzyme required for sulfatase activity